MFLHASQAEVDRITANAKKREAGIQATISVARIATARVC